MARLVWIAVTLICLNAGNTHGQDGTSSPVVQPTTTREVSMASTQELLSTTVDVMPSHTTTAAFIASVPSTAPTHTPVATPTATPTTTTPPTTDGTTGTTDSATTMTTEATTMTTEATTMTTDVTTMTTEATTMTTEVMTSTEPSTEPTTDMTTDSPTTADPTTEAPTTVEPTTPAPTTTEESVDTSQPPTTQSTTTASPAVTMPTGVSNEFVIAISVICVGIVLLLLLICFLAFVLYAVWRRRMARFKEEVVWVDTENGPDKLLDVKETAIKDDSQEEGKKEIVEAGGEEELGATTAGTFGFQGEVVKNEETTKGDTETDVSTQREE